MEAADVDPHNYAAPQAPPESARTPPQRLSLSERTWRGTKFGFRWVTYLTAPICFTVLILMLAPTPYGLGARRGFGVHPYAAYIVGVYLVFALFGAGLGALVGLIVFFLVWERALHESRTWWGGGRRTNDLAAKDEVKTIALPSTPAERAASQRPRRRRRWPWFVGTPVLAIFVAAFVLGVQEGRKVDRRLANSLAATDRDDPSWRLRDLMAARMPIRDDENSAIVVAKVAALLPESWPGKTVSRWVMPNPPVSAVVLALERLEATESNTRLAMLDEIIRRIRDAEIPASSAGYGRREDGLGPLTSPWGKLALDNQRAAGLIWMNELISIARRPASERSAPVKKWEASIDRIRSSDYGLFQPTLLLALMHPMVKINDAHSRYQSELGAIAILLAAERHRRKLGEWPASISAIDAAILPDAPKDPFSDKPFLVARGDGEFLVYSIGSNLKDEQGANQPSLWSLGTFDDYGFGASNPTLRRRAPLE
jgi:hypothetical protein